MGNVNRLGALRKTDFRGVDLFQMAQTLTNFRYLHLMTKEIANI
jgi:hypothetical protein